MPEITILTGKKEEGKTSLICDFIDSLKNNGRTIGGIVSPGIIENGTKIAIEIVDLKGGDKRILATHSPGWDVEKPMREWRFIKDSVNWGNKIIKNAAIPCDVLIIDEIGYLELEKNQGWISVFDTIEARQFDQAYIVVRESLLDLATARWNDARIIHLSEINDNNAFIRRELTRIQPKSS